MNLPLLHGSGGEGRGEEAPVCAGLGFPRFSGQRGGGARQKKAPMEPSSSSSKSPKRRHDETFKQAAVELLVNSGKPPKQIAQELGVSIWNLRDWKRRYLPAPPAPARTLEQVEAENRALREELQRVKIQRDILKKTLGIISAPPDHDSHA